jgi:hypothetical protein
MSLIQLLADKEHDLEAASASWESAGRSLIRMISGEFDEFSLDAFNAACEDVRSLTPKVRALAKDVANLRGRLR